MAIVKINELTDIVILICCSFSLFIHYIRLLISRLQVQVLSGARQYQLVTVMAQSLFVAFPPADVIRFSKMMGENAKQKFIDVAIILIQVFALMFSIYIKISSIIGSKFATIH